MTERIVVVTLGDSIIAGTPGWDPDPDVRRRQGANDERSQLQHWAGRRDPRLELRNHGVNGERTDEIAKRLDGAVTDASALVVQGGINDLLQGRSIASTAEHLYRMVHAGLERKLTVAIAELLPWNNGWPAGESPIRRLNAMIARIADRTGVQVMPFHVTVEDQARPGRMREEWTADGNHPSVAGYRRLGELAFSLPEACDR